MKIAIIDSFKAKLNFYPVKCFMYKNQVKGDYAICNKIISRKGKMSKKETENAIATEAEVVENKKQPVKNRSESNKDSFLIIVVTIGISILVGFGGFVGGFFVGRASYSDEGSSVRLNRTNFPPRQTSGSRIRTESSQNNSSSTKSNSSTNSSSATENSN